jgi:hypothetical protein
MASSGVGATFGGRGVTQRRDGAMFLKKGPASWAGVSPAQLEHMLSSTAPPR